MAGSTHWWRISLHQPHHRKLPTVEIDGGRELQWAHLTLLIGCSLSQVLAELGMPLIDEGEENRARGSFKC